MTKTPNSPEAQARKLEPCPYCRVHADERSRAIQTFRPANEPYSFYTRYECSNCGLRSVCRLMTEEAAEEWNRLAEALCPRPSSPSLPEGVKKTLLYGLFRYECELDNQPKLYDCTPEYAEIEAALAFLESHPGGVDWGTARQLLEAACPLLLEAACSDDGDNYAPCMQLKQEIEIFLSATLPKAAP